MSLRAKKHKFTGSTTAITSYDATKTNLGTLIAQKTGSTAVEKYVGPPVIGVARPMQEVVDTSGYASSTSTTVSGSFTVSFTSAMTGMKIGFGDTDPANITAWYTLGALTNYKTIAITSGPTIGYVPYVIVANIPGKYPHVIPFSSTIDWVFMIENLATATTARRILFYEYNKITSIYTWKGFINSTLLNGVYANTIRGFKALRYLHTTGTASNSGTAVTGVGTKWQTEKLAVGARIGFGSTDPIQISENNWRTITSVNSETSITYNKPVLPIFYKIVSSSDSTKLVGYGSDHYIYISPDSGMNWIKQTSAGRRYWSGITSSNDGTKLAAVAYPGYVYTSADSGITWTQQTNSGMRPWYSIDSSADGTKLAATVGNGNPDYIYTSTDSGVTWSTNGNSSGSRDWQSITSSSDGTKLVAGFADGPIWYSINSGATWNLSNSVSAQWQSITSSSDGTKLVAIIYGGYIYYSSDSGATWAQSNSILTNWRDVTSSDDGTKLAAVDGAPGYIYTSIDSGATWSTNGDSSGSRAWYSVTSSADGTTLIANDDKEVFISTDSGVTWNRQTNLGTKNWHSVASSSDGIKLAACVIGNGYIYTSIDSGVTWTERTNSGLKDWSSITSSSNGNKLAAIVFGGYIYYSSDSGATWTTNGNSSGARSWQSIASSSDGTKLAATEEEGYIYTSSDSGATWTTNGNSSGARSWGSITSSADGTKLAAVIYNYMEGGYIYTSSNSGLNWTTNGNSSGSRSWQSIASSSDGTKLVAAVQDGYIYTSSDSGVTWSTNGNSSGSRIWHSVVSSSDGTKLAAVIYNSGNGGYIYTSTDSGLTWSTNGNSSGSRTWRGIASSADGTKLTAVVYGNYIYTSADSGFTWNTEDKTLSVSNVPCVIEELRFAITVSQATEPQNGGLFLVKGVNYSDFIPTGTTISAGTFTDNQKAVYKLSDAGNTETSQRFWTTNNNSSGSRNWYCITSSSDGTKLAAVVGAPGYIYTSPDAGVTWTTNSNSSGSRYWQSIASSADGTKLAACIYTSSDYIYTSSNSGVTWTTNGNSSGLRAWNSIASSADGTKLAAVDGAPGYIYTSPDAGVTWTTNSNSSGSRYWKSITSSSDGTKLAACVIGNDYIYTSSDSGATWTTNGNSSGSRNWYSITSSSDGTKLAAVVDGGYIYTSPDSGVTWNTNGNSSGSRSWTSITSSSDGTKLAATVNFGGYIYTSTDSGVSWTEQTNPGTKWWLCIASSADGTKLAAGVNGSGGYIYTSNSTGVPTNISPCGLAVVPESNKGLHYAYVLDGLGSTYARIYRYNLRATSNSVSDGKLLVSLSYTTSGTVTVSSGVVTASGTPFTSAMVGMKIGFGSTSPTLISTWYTIGTYTSTSEVTLTDLTVNVSAGTSYIVDSSDVISTAPQLVTGTVVGDQSMTAGTLQHGAGANVQSLYFLTASRIYRASTSNIFNGNIDWISDNRPEIPPGGVNSYPLTGTLNSIEIDESMDRLIVLSNGLNSTRNYVTRYPLLTNDCFDTIFGVNTRQQDTILTNGSSYVTSGTVTVSGSQVTGTNTFFTSALVGSRIGFGSTNPASISTWYTIARYTSRTVVELGSPSLTGSGLRSWSSITSSSDGTKVVAGCTNERLYYSSDSGATWTQSNSISTSWYSIASSSDGTKLAAVVYNGYIYTSVDSGLSWTQSNSISAFWSSITSSSDGTKLAAAVSGGLIWTSTNAGLNWSTNGNSGSGDWQPITSSSDGTKLAAVLYGDYIYTSTDSGLNWTPRDSGRNWISIASSSDGTKLAAVVQSGYIYTSTDSGVTWTTNGNSSGSRTWYNITSSSDGTKLAAVLYGGYIYTSTDSGVTWSTNGNSSGSRYWISITSSADGTKLAAVVSPGYIYTSTDSGVTWTDNNDADIGPEYVIDTNPQTVTHFNTALQTTSVSSSGGITHIAKQGTTPELNQLYSLPLSAHWTFTNTTNQRVITPVMYTPDCAKFQRVYIADVNSFGSGEFSITPEPYRVYYRIPTGLNLDIGDWTLIDEDGDLSSISSAPHIQFMIEFATIGIFCVPARIMSLTVIYDDTTISTDSHYEPSMTKSNAVNKEFAWRFATGFGGTVPTLRVRIFNALTGDLLHDDYTTGTKGVWKKSINDGANWVDYNTTDKTNEITYIRYTPLSFGDNIKVRVVLTQ